MFQLPNNLYPFESHWLEIDGIQMHYLDEGPRDAPIVLMVHGNPTWSFYYRNLVTALRADYQCIVPDHIGCGLSDKPGDRDYHYTLQSRIDDLEALLEAIDIKENITILMRDPASLWLWCTAIPAGLFTTAIW